MQLLLSSAALALAAGVSTVLAGSPANTASLVGSTASKYGITPATFGGNIGDLIQCARALSVRSCSNNTEIKGGSAGACCLNTWLQSNQTDVGKQSGLILTTQFWDGGASNETDIPNSWTIHGIWPDYCDGTYPAYCNTTTGIPEFTGAQIEALIKKYDAPLYATMKKYYLGVNGSDATFWEHEYNKHGTCFSTLRAQCNFPLYGLSREETVVLSYFREIVKQWKARPTYKWLADAGIVPVNNATKVYPLKDIQAALKKASGGLPFLGCQKGTNLLNEVWYYNYVQGPLINGYYTPTDAGSYNTTCPELVSYIPKV